MFQTDLQNSPPISTSRLIRRVPFFYGWVVLAAGTLGMIMTSPGQTYTISIFIEHFIRDLGISRSAVSSFYAVGTLVGSFALPFVGRAIDRSSPSRMVAIISILFGLACIFMGMVQNAAMLLAGFIAVRMLGQGSLGLVSTYVINQWWMRRRGTIMGISGVLMALLGLGSFPNLVNWLIPQIGWRAAYMVLGGALIVIMAPLGLLFYRERPERYGLQPDSKGPLPPSGESQAALYPEENWTAAEARRTRAFWILSLGLGAISMLSTGLTFHMVSIFADNGLSATAAAAVFVPIAVTSAVVNLGSGILVDRMSVRLLLAVTLLIQALVMWMAQVLQSVEMVVLYGIVLGMLMGLQRTVGAVVWPAYFGRLHLGSITGITQTILIAGSALGPLPLGIARDLLGDYNLALTFLALPPLALSVLSLLVKRPIKTRLQ